MSLFKKSLGSIASVIKNQLDGKMSNIAAKKEIVKVFPYDKMSNDTFTLACTHQHYCAQELAQAIVQESRFAVSLEKLRKNTIRTKSAHFLRRPDCHKISGIKPIQILIDQFIDRSVKNSKGVVVNDPENVTLVICLGDPIGSMGELCRTVYFGGAQFTLISVIYNNQNHCISRSLMTVNGQTQIYQADSFVTGGIFKPVAVDTGETDFFPDVIGQGKKQFTEDKLITKDHYYAVVLYYVRTALVKEDLRFENVTKSIESNRVITPGRWVAYQRRGVTIGENLTQISRVTKVDLSDKGHLIELESDYPIKDYEHVRLLDDIPPGPLAGLCEMPSDAVFSMSKGQVKAFGCLSQSNLPLIWRPMSVKDYTLVEGHIHFSVSTQLSILIDFLFTW